MSLRKEFECVKQLLSELARKIESQLEASFRGGAGGEGGMPREERLRQNKNVIELGNEFIQILDGYRVRIYQAVEEAKEKRDRIVATLQRSSTTQPLE